jgi:hypothetical protein
VNGRLGDDELENYLYQQVYSTLDSEASAWDAAHLRAIDAGIPDPDSDLSPRSSRASAPRFDAWILGWLPAEQVPKPVTIKGYDYLTVDDGNRRGHVTEFFEVRDGVVIDHNVTLGELDALL